jgi:DNA-directed RNA polymerase specialized sigma24 family protein
LPIRRKTQDQLAALDDDGLMAYVVEARSEGETEQYESALGVLVFRWERTFLNRASRKIGESCRRSGYLSIASEAEEIVLETFKDVFRGVDRFEGEAAGQFHKWVQTILDRRVADWFRSRSNEPKVDSYDGARNGDGEVVGMYEIVGDGEIDVEMTVELRILWDEALAAESERDAAVVVLKAQGYSAADVAAIIQEEGLDDGEGMSTDNVDTIYSRFRSKNRGLFLEEAEIEVGEPGDRGGEDGDGQS